MKQWLEKGQECLTNKKLASKLVVCLGLLGMALILISELWDTKDIDPIKGDKTTPSPVMQDGTQVTTVTISTEERYRSALEETLAALIGQLDGAGETVVMITLRASEETVYAQNVVQGDSQISESYVILPDGTALSEMVYTPTVCGVAVLCDGGDSITIEAKIIAMVTALFDISSNHVVVEKLEHK